MKVRPAKKSLALGGVLLLCAIACVGYGIVEPQSLLGRTVFHVGYSLPAHRPAFLRFYQWSLREYNGSSVPGSIDELLLTRLRASNDDRERQAIIDFQITQSPYRWGDSFCHADDDIKKQIIGDIFRRLDTFPWKKANDALVLIESLRRNDTLHKGGFTTRSRPINGIFTLGIDHLAVVKDAFRRWWSDGTAWPANKSQEPLKGTEFRIQGGP